MFILAIITTILAIGSRSVLLYILSIGLWYLTFKN